MAEDKSTWSGQRAYIANHDKQNLRILMQNLFYGENYPITEKCPEILQKPMPDHAVLYGHYGYSYISGKDLIEIINAFFPGTWIYYASENGNDETESYQRHEYVYDPVERKLFHGYAEYSYGKRTVFNEPFQPPKDENGQEIVLTEAQLRARIKEAGTRTSVKEYSPSMKKGKAIRIAVKNGADKKTLKENF